MADEEYLLAAGAAIGDVLHDTFSGLSQAERVFVLNMCLQQELNPPADQGGMSFDEFEKVFDAVKAEEDAKRA